MKILNISIIYEELSTHTLLETDRQTDRQTNKSKSIYTIIYSHVYATSSTKTALSIYGGTNNVH